MATVDTQSTIGDALQSHSGIPASLARSNFRRGRKKPLKELKIDIPSNTSKEELYGEELTSPVFVMPPETTEPVSVTQAIINTAEMGGYSEKVNLAEEESTLFNEIVTSNPFNKNIVERNPFDGIQIVNPFVDETSLNNPFVDIYYLSKQNNNPFGEVERPATPDLNVRRDSLDSRSSRDSIDLAKNQPKEIEYTKIIKFEETNPFMEEIAMAEGSIPNYDLMSQDQRDIARADFIVKFGRIKNEHKGYSIPEITEHTSLRTIHLQYNIFVKDIERYNEEEIASEEVEGYVSNYKYYILFFWILVAAAGLKFDLGLDGFLEKQIKSFGRYDKLLRRLGETKYRDKQKRIAEGTETEWSPEGTIMLMCVFNIISFVVIKYASKYLGEQNSTVLMDALVTQLGFSESTSTGQPTEIEDVIPGAKGLDFGGLLGNVMPLLGGMIGGAKQAAQGAQGQPKVRQTFTE